MQALARMFAIALKEARFNSVLGATVPAIV